jgi:hypothetical protein
VIFFDRQPTPSVMLYALDTTTETARKELSRSDLDSICAMATSVKLRIAGSNRQSANQAQGVSPPKVVHTKQTVAGQRPLNLRCAIDDAPVWRPTVCACWIDFTLTRRKGLFSPTHYHLKYRQRCGAWPDGGLVAAAFTQLAARP